MRRARGFTLVEMLVALFAMAVLAALSWRGLDGMLRAQQLTRAHADDVLAVQTGLAQWEADLQAIAELPGITALEWNGRVLRLTRRASGGAPAILVVGWAAREGQWRRWQSAPLTSRGEHDAAWLQADHWAQNPGDALRAGEVAITPLAGWEIFYFRENAWTHPLSADQATGVPPNPQAAPPVGGRSTGTLPDAVRLVLQVPPGQPLAGQLVKDWLRPGAAGRQP